ncbi:hypothetical protein C4J81_18595 (plasmid) [Deltaproteobacteria bacterium Smac51]|nr:hypothetical protein C4J81_18595 [Deltaproteobacteria bacterium Smac51]
MDCGRGGTVPVALVTGAGGFLGSHICLALQRAGWQVLALTRAVQKSRYPGIVPIIGDILEPHSLNEAVRHHGCDAIIHFAAVIGGTGQSDDQLMGANAIGTSNLLKLYDKSRAEVFIYASSLPCIGFPEVLPVKESHPVKPLSVYHVSKYIGERLALDFARKSSRRVLALRITAPYGPGMANSVLAIFLKAALAKQALFLYGSGRRSQNFVWADDVAKAVRAALERGEGLCNCGGPESITMLDLAVLISRLTNAPPENIQFSGQPDPQEQYRWVVDSSLLSEQLGYAPGTALAEGCADLRNFLIAGKPWPGWWTEEFSC